MSRVLSDGNRDVGIVLAFAALKYVCVPAVLGWLAWRLVNGGER